jgi:hypothetical protein
LCICSSVQAQVNDTTSKKTIDSLAGKIHVQSGADSIVKAPVNTTVAATAVAPPPAVQFGGGILATTINYTARGIENRQQPFTYYITGNPWVYTKGVYIPIAFSYTRPDPLLAQPYNQIGASPTYKWLTLHLGYRNIQYTPYTLAGHTMLGAGFDIKPGKLRAGFMYGRLNSAVKIDTARQALVPYGFSRKGYAAKLGYGTDSNFVEFSYLRARDDSNSVDRDIPNYNYYITPAGNSVLGFATRFTYKHFFIGATGAGSVFTNDLNSPIRIDSVKQAILKIIKKLAPFNGTSQFFTALDASVGYAARLYNIKVQYRRVDPNFQTMGGYYFENDVASWSLVPAATLFKGKARFSGSIGLQHDNLKQQKGSETHKVIGSLVAGIDLSPRLALFANYTNFLNDQRPALVQFPDSLRIVQSTNNLMIAPRYTITTADIVHVFTLTGTYNRLKDFNQIITSSNSTNRSVETRQYSLSYVISFPKKGLGSYITPSRTEFISPELNYKYQGIMVGAYGAFFKQKLNINISNSLMQSVLETGNTIIDNITSNISYNVGKHQALKVVTYITINNPPSGSFDARFREYRNEVSYIYNF